MDLTAWIMSIVGVAVLTLLVDILVPEGETSKYIKSVFAILTVLIIASPLPKLFSSEFVFEDFFGETEAAYVDYDYAERLNERRIEFLENKVAEVLSDKKFECRVTIDARFDKGKMIIERIKIKTQKSVIVGTEANIDIIKEFVKEMTGVDGNRIEVGY